MRSDKSLQAFWDGYSSNHLPLPGVFRDQASLYYYRGLVVKRVFLAQGSEWGIRWSAFLLLCVFLFAGCAANKQGLSSPVADMKQLFGLSQYYAKYYTTVRAKPDSTSRALGKISTNTKVTEISKNELGWSQVKTADGKLEGWLPTSSLSPRPVKTATKTRAKEKTEPKSAAKKEEPAAAEAPQSSTHATQESEIQSPKPEHEESSGGLLSPPAAAAETIPPASAPPAEPPASRKASPDMFDSF